MSRKEDAIALQIFASKAFEAGRMKDAWETWCKIYDLYECKEMSEGDFREQQDVMDRFTDEEVYAITDYGKRLIGYR